MIVHCALCVYGFLVIGGVLSSSGTMSVDRECCMRRGGLLEPRSSCSASLEEQLYVHDGLTTERVVHADDVVVEESTNDGSGSTVHNHAGWVHRRPYKQ